MSSEPLGPHMTVTPVGDGWNVSARNGDPLGTIEWHARWRLYEFVPHPRTGYTASCCCDLARFLDRVTAERKARRGGA